MQGQRKNQQPVMVKIGDFKKTPGAKKLQI